MQRLNCLIQDSDSDEEVIPRRPRWLKERIDLFEYYDDRDFTIRFRLSKEATLFLLTKIEHKLEYISDRNFSISPMNQLLGTLRFYATNSTQMLIGDICGWSTPTANKIIHRVSATIAALHKEYIKFPTTQQEMRKEQDNFYQIARFPRVIGAMDCTHIKLSFVPLRCQVGGEQAELYRNRKGFFSINVQTICNTNLEITDIVARWPGSCHDSTIFNNSVIKAKFEDGCYDNSILVVDGGYASTSYMMPPLGSPRTQVEQLYNESQIRTRNPIERSYGVWKRRFPVLALGMRVKLEKALTIIVATAVLHNILRRRGEILPPDDPELEIPAPWEQIINDGQMSQAVSGGPVQQHEARDAIIANYFSSLV
ncbi:putative nuclease HARBI1 [Helicoverpa zea]|uniref:putative nuclease HARBI1 n=1 Tax=Helicoverpa zea TaxID=7113 RepID=UPI001F5608BA|nr:putative nuclease HARBI1 [Helicoverpa zea]XP_047038361.1 putative nuclease HARBI1 [Helicoverpa zea]